MIAATGNRHFLIRALALHAINQAMLTRNAT